MTTRLIVWRHGQTEWNLDNRVQGQSDAHLSDAGIEQAEKSAALLFGIPPDLIVSSDLKRAADTAAVLAARTGLPVRTDPRLRERHFGQWQGHTLAEIRDRWPEESARWRAGDPDPGCGVEHAAALAARAGEALREASADGLTVIVATHGGAARAGAIELLGWPHGQLSQLGGLNNCHWIDLRHSADRGWQLAAHNVGA